MEKYLRKKALHFIGNAAAAKLRFNGPEYRSVAGLIPDALNLPAIYIFRGSDPMEDLTNEERSSSMRVHIVAFLHDSGDVEAQKADLQDDLEELIYDDITLGGIAVQAKVTHSDPTAFALTPLGFSGPVIPPLAAFRMDIEITLDYGAFT